MKYVEEKICLNVLAKDIANAREISEIMEGNVLIGVLAKDYPANSDFVEAICEYKAEIDGMVSIGLGAGNPIYGYNVVKASMFVKTPHINQVFPLTASTREHTSEKVIVNSLIKPSSQKGKVIINTGPFSSQYEDQQIETEAAIVMAKEMGANSIKFYPMKGLAHIDEYEQVCSMAAKHDMYIEPTGGLDLDNIEQICEIALEKGVKKIIPHVYTSIIDEDGNTRCSDVKQLKTIIDKLLQRAES